MPSHHTIKSCSEIVESVLLIDAIQNQALEIKIGKRNWRKQTIQESVASKFQQTHIICKKGGSRR